MLLRRKDDMGGTDAIVMPNVFRELNSGRARRELHSATRPLGETVRDAVDRFAAREDRTRRSPHRPRRRRRSCHMRAAWAGGCRPVNRRGEQHGRERPAGKHHRRSADRGRPPRLPLCPSPVVAPRMTAEAFYTREGDRYVPTGLGTSPWNPRAQMGVALAGLAVHAMEAVPSPAPMAPARLTIDILGAVPLAPVVATTRIVREGRRVQLVETELLIEGRPWLRATALRLREATSPEAATPLTRGFPDTPPPPGLSWAETKRIEGDYAVPGPGATWTRMKAQVVAGVPLTPLEAVAMIADFGSGTAPLVPLRDWTFANVDIAVHLTRRPRGEWFLIDSTSESAGNGIGLTHSRLGDREGMIGMAHQTTFLEPR
ncbi:thioesterase family protein [Sphingomonas solaris]|uniref:Thioesterase family protein n=2 Tax=Alterirhizorhabdus solaris TaxID=2529389 RepID=A0A558R1S9_9SPHN|nr:thioesterase family protein [Sphingomonas solaris]